jgi:arylsulfatase I/J
LLLGLTDIGYADPTFSTPNLDLLATQGIKLNRMYAASTCSPTRASLLTGKYANNVGLQDGALFFGESRMLPPQFKILPSLLKSRGYRTYGIGKWHLGYNTTSSIPSQRGFDTFYGNHHGTLDYFKYNIGLSCNSQNPVNSDTFPRNYGSNCFAVNGFDVLSNGIPDPSIINSGTHYTSVLQSAALKSIASHDTKKPMFLYLAVTAPHSPLQVTGEHAARCAAVPQFPPGLPTNPRNLICQLMAGVDDLVGAVMASLQTRKMLSNTIFVYTSDNGGVRMFGSTNGGLNGQKGSFFEGGVRVPSFISGTPLSALAGVVYDDLVHTTDLTATMGLLAG